MSLLRNHDCRVVRLEIRSRNNPALSGQVGSASGPIRRQARARYIQGQTVLSTLLSSGGLLCSLYSRRTAWPPVKNTKFENSESETAIEFAKQTQIAGFG